MKNSGKKPYVYNERKIWRNTVVKKDKSWTYVSEIWDRRNVESKLP